MVIQLHMIQLKLALWATPRHKFSKPLFIHSKELLKFSVHWFIHNFGEDQYFIFSLTDLCLTHRNYSNFLQLLYVYLTLEAVLPCLYYNLVLFMSYWEVVLSYLMCALCNIHVNHCIAKKVLIVKLISLLGPCTFFALWTLQALQDMFQTWANFLSLSQLLMHLSYCNEQAFVSINYWVW